MIRSLVIRQTFLVLDAALVVLALAVGVMIVFKFFEAPVMPPPPSLTATSAADMAEIVKSVAPRGNYDAILQARLFGDAGAKRAEVAEPVTESPATAPPPTELNLRLIGTTATQKLASAIIEDGTQPGSARSYGIGEPIVQDVTLVEVHPRHVLIHNKQNGKDQKEVLEMDGEKAEAPQVAVATPALNSSGTERVTLKRAELMQDIVMNYQDLITKVKPELYRDASGKVVGITANNIGQIPVAKKLGIADGDVLQTVNNEPIDSEAKIFEMVSKYQNATSFRIGIMRNGKPKMVTYRLE